jgi:hypothetical protein
MSKLQSIAVHQELKRGLRTIVYRGKTGIMAMNKLFLFTRFFHYMRMYDTEKRIGTETQLQCKYRTSHTISIPSIYILPNGMYIPFKRLGCIITL